MSERFKITNRRGEPIRDLAEWQALGGPAGDSGWKRHRSAYELARAWIETAEGPKAARAALDRCDDLRGFVAAAAIAEAQTRFDAFGGPRNHDLLVLGESPAGPVVVAIEGKADETFGQTLEEYRAAADARRAAGEGTNAPERLTGLVAALTGSTLDARPELLPLRYQLFSAVAGTLVEASLRSAQRAVLLVHEFATPLTRPATHAANAADLASFVRVAFASAVPAEPPWCIGPFTVPGSERIPVEVDLYVAKVTSRIE